MNGKVVRREVSIVEVYMEVTLLRYDVDEYMV